MIWKKLVGATLPCVVLFLGCGESPQAVAEVTCELGDEPTLPYPEWRVLRLTWQSRQALPEAPGEPTAFVHLWDKAGALLRTFDHRLPEPWQGAGAISYDLELYQSVLAAPLPPGDYTLSLGLYTPDGRRWPVALTGETGKTGAAVGEEVRRGEYRVATLTIPSVSPEMPTFAFSTEWREPQAGNDLQVPALRWMAGEATIRVGNLGVPGSLWLRVNLPAASDDWYPRIHTGTEPQLEVRADCSDTQEALTPPGVYELVLPVYGADADASCQLSFSSNYTLIHSVALEERTAALEVLAWSPAIL